MYQVWTKEEFGDTWKLEECADQAEVKKAILAATKGGNEIKISQPMGFSVNVTLTEELQKAPAKKEKPLTMRQIQEKEVSKSEATQSGPETDQDTGG